MVVFCFVARKCFLSIFHLFIFKMITDFAKEKVFWTRKMNLKLAKFMQTRPNIWNPKHPKYTSVEHRDRTYAEFATKYGDEFTGQAVKERWTNIRSTFAFYLRKLNASRVKDCASAEEYKITWHLWDACQFLLSVNKKGLNELSEDHYKQDKDEHRESWISGDNGEVPSAHESDEKGFWTRKMNLKLIRFIKARPYIWNPKHPKYTSVEHKDGTYDVFASKYGEGLTGQVVKDHWQNICRTFAYYLQKNNSSCAKDGVKEYKVTWPLWDACQFLLTVNQKGQSELLEEHDKQDNNGDHQEGWISEDHFEVPSAHKSQDVCKSIAENLVNILQGIQNDDYDLMASTKYGNIGQAVSKTLSRMNSFDAANVSQEIMGILLLYDKDNPDNPNNKSVKAEY